ncbi:protein CHROMATIN REMODELING 35-like isoform X2 [Actinidia eriantha]|uniref:protein CHROMATIN REMODELING 35-like isoform X1 n=1 Tax=Actinidia eriantha TaxID=165200 RepID=UPI002587F9F3|nr:protein CHROMATIN REMODELING 35-like isoform X1 [Actinidia eriantha]XP_057502992.1 protein CHROMATIN REMODELING 35-like isoform X2 [Actinidia eriantha]
MESAIEDWPNNYVSPIAVKLLPISPTDLYYKGRKRIRSPSEERLHGSVAASAYTRDEPEQKKARTDPKVIDYSDPFAVPNLLEELDGGKFGSVTKEIKDLLARRRQMLDTLFAMHPTLVDVEKRLMREASKVKQPATSSVGHDVIELDDDGDENDVPARRLTVVQPVNLPERPVVVIDSDDEEPGNQRSFAPPYQQIVLSKPVGEFLMKDFLTGDFSQNRKSKKDNGKLSGGNEARKDHTTRPSEIETTKDKGVYVGVDNDMDSEEGSHGDSDSDGLADIWNEMGVALECSKDTVEDPPPDDLEGEEEDDCDHAFVMKDDLGSVCRICGVIQRSIETIIEYQYAKGTRSIRTYSYEPRSTKDKEANEIFSNGVKYSGQDFIVAEISAHPRHRKQMKPHQVEGFNFLLSNLVTENPGGCIMAHAPGSGKTFMIISFMQSFLAKYPHAKPLVVLPRGILATWKKEFQRWQVEDIPLYDFYSVKADNRSQQLEVLKQWAGQKSILFLGYKQFSSIVCDTDSSKIAVACQEILLTYPSILILDEGHTPRNENTDVLNSLKKVQTPRKVVLSGTLYQNHVKEVFNIFDLVRPKFLKMETSRSIIKRILGRVPSVKRYVKAKGLDNVFYESVEHALQKDENFKRKTTVIRDLREMTSKVLHFYKGDFLDELPGLVDFTVYLNLSPTQKHEIQELRKLNRKFKISSDGSALYVHPQLRNLLKISPTREREGLEDAKMDQILEKLDVKDGVKAKFFLNMLGLCESGGEKLLVFSPYLQPLKFLERLAVKVKGWSLGKEIFVITGDSSSEIREWSMDRFNTSPDAKVFFGSIKACGEGISLVGASRIIILDVHLNPSVTRQAIGRAFRPGQEKKVYTYRLVAADSPEEEDHATCFRKESISKMWFEWNEYCRQNEFEMETVDVKDCGDHFMESSKLSEDVKALYKR